MRLNYFQYVSTTTSWKVCTLPWIPLRSLLQDVVGMVWTNTSGHSSIYHMGYLLCVQIFKCDVFKFDKKSIFCKLFRSDVLGPCRRISKLWREHTCAYINTSVRIMFLKSLFFIILRCIIKSIRTIIHVHDM